MLEVTSSNVRMSVKKANTLNWKNFTKLIIHIADCPSHGHKYNGGLKDDNSNLNPDFKGEFKKFYGKGIHYHIYKINNFTNKMISEFRNEAPENMVIKESECFETDTLGKTMQFTASYSISKTLDQNVTKGKCGLVGSVDLLFDALCKEKRKITNIR